MKKRNIGLAQDNLVKAWYAQGINKVARSQAMLSSVLQAMDALERRLSRGQAMMLLTACRFITRWVQLRCVERDLIKTGDIEAVSDMTDALIEAAIARDHEPTKRKRRSKR